MATEIPVQLNFQQVRTRRVFEDICEQIRQQLASGALRPGDKLPAERDLAQEFKVSRPAVREALRTLEISGVVSLQKGVKGGAFIRDGNPATLTQSLQDLLFLGRVSMRSLAEARELMLGSVIRLACERATEEDCRKMEQTLDEIESIDELGYRAQLSMQFFRQIAEATRNEVLTILVDSLGDIVRYVTDKVGRKSRPELFAVRRRILKAIRARDVIAATRAMNEYLANVHDVMDDEPIALRRPGREPAPPAVARTAAAKPRAKAKPKMRIAEKAAGKSVAKPRPRPRTA